MERKIILWNGNVDGRRQKIQIKNTWSGTKYNVTIDQEKLIMLSGK
jgi:hypothetical protein